MQVSNFIEAKKQLMDFFGVDEDFFVSPLTDKQWEIVSEEEGYYFLRYGNTDGVMQRAVIVKKDCKPMIYKSRKYTMVVALDCVKVCFIFDNTNKI